MKLKNTKKKQKINLGLMGLILIVILTLALQPVLQPLLKQPIREGNDDTTNDEIQDNEAALQEAESNLDAAYNDLGIAIDNKNSINKDGINNTTANAMFNYTSLQGKSNNIVSTLMLILTIVILIIVIFLFIFK